MDVDDLWRHTHEQRRVLATMLRDLSDEEWAVWSLTPGWTVRDVAAHVMGSATVTPLEMALVRYGDRYNTLVAEDARRAHRLGFLFHDSARRRPVEVRATDADFPVGSGPLVERLT